MAQHCPILRMNNNPIVSISSVIKHLLLFSKSSYCEFWLCGTLCILTVVYDQNEAWKCGFLLKAKKKKAPKRKTFSKQHFSIYCSVTSNDLKGFSNDHEPYGMEPFWNPPHTPYPLASHCLKKLIQDFQAAKAACFFLRTKSPSLEFQNCSMTIKNRWNIIYLNLWGVTFFFTH